eukprot:TRINITY_DN13237_c0_g2_i1.p2 TRINITY_DN13237_c0_g2~~TRINITY_DN13237_c0_g2_i1.p2  ORF type:complete len:180 (+),score=22.88 TRINITY_DN13237_c0_g2_i1:120-659(+)
MNQSYLGQSGKYRPRPLAHYLQGAGSWAAAGVLAYYVLKYYYGGTRKVTPQDVATVDGPAFELLQAQVNTRVKENDRNQVVGHLAKLSDIEQAARVQSGDLDSRLDFMTPLVNMVDVNGNTVAVESPEARRLQQWMEIQGNKDFTEEIKKRREIRADFYAPSPEKKTEGAAPPTAPAAE